MAVAIQPVKFQAPVEVSGTGTTGSLTYTTKAGYTGALNYVIRGLQAAAKTGPHARYRRVVQLRHGEPGRDGRRREGEREHLHDACRSELRSFPDVRIGRERLGARSRHVRLPGCSWLVELRARRHERWARPERGRQQHFHGRPRRRCAVEDLRARVQRGRSGWQLLVVRMGAHRCQQQPVHDGSRRTGLSLRATSSRPRSAGRASRRATAISAASSRTTARPR